MTRRKTHEEFVAEVKALVGDEYEVLSKYVHAKEKVKMSHKKCGKSFETRPTNFISKGYRCWNCSIKRNSSKLKKSNTTFLKEVKKSLGGDYEVLSKYESSKNDVLVLHKKCGRKYMASPGNLIKGNNCKCLLGSRISEGKQFGLQVFIDELLELGDGEYKYVGGYSNRSEHALIKHKKCGEVYPVKPSLFKQGTRCPRCRISKGEHSIQLWLNSEKIKFTPQVPIKYSENRKPLFLDFLVEGVAIEYDGEQHFKPIEVFGGEDGLKNNQRRDAIKTKYCADSGIPLIRIPYWDFDNIDAILTEKLLPLLNDADKHDAS